MGVFHVSQIVETVPHRAKRLMRQLRGHPLSTYAKFSEKLDFPENFAYVLNGWRLRYRILESTE